MKCHVCGFENEGDSLFCEKCGTKLMKSQTSPTPEPVKGGENQKPAGKSPKGLYAVIAVLFVGIAVVLAVYLSGNARMERKLAEAERSLEAMSREKRQESVEASRMAAAASAKESRLETTPPPATAAEEPLVIVVPEPATAPPARKETVTVYINNGSSDYIIPGSDSRYLTGDDLRNLSEAQLRLARNEIYARHGRRFKDRSLQEYFDAKSWYYGYIEPDKFVDDEVLNRYEIANRDLIVSYESR